MGGEGFQTLIDKLLYALAFVGFRRVDVACRISHDAVRAKEQPWLASTVTKFGEHFQ